MCNEHSKHCRHNDDDCIKYAFMEIAENKMILIDAEELAFLDDMLELAKKGEDVPVDDTTIDSTKPKLVYGAVLVDANKSEDTSEILDIVKQMEGYGFFHIAIEKATLCKYSKIKLFPELAVDSTFIPFAAVMQIPFSLENQVCAYTLTPLAKPKDGDWCILDFLLNRPFLLACREEVIIDDLTPENFETYINKEDLMSAYHNADLVDETEEEL